jgi:hypothetical protein
VKESPNPLTQQTLNEISRNDDKQSSSQPDSPQYLSPPSQHIRKQSVKELMDDAFTPLPINTEILHLQSQGRDHMHLSLNVAEEIVGKMKSWAGIDRVDSIASRVDRVDSIAKREDSTRSRSDEKRIVEVDGTIGELIALEENFCNIAGLVVDVSPDF